MYRIFIAFVLSIAAILPAFSQQVNLSQFSHTPFLTNPGMIGVIERSNVRMNHRNQTVDAGQTFATSAISGYYPHEIGNHRFGLGASFINDRMADFMSTNGGILGTAYSIQFAKRHQLSLGVQLGLYNRSLNADAKFTTDSQFQDGSFRPDAPIGEVLPTASRNFLTLATGLYWEMNNKDKKTLAFSGISFFDVNEPTVGFDSNTNLPVSPKVIGGLLLHHNDRFAVTPNFRWIYFNNYHLLNLGSAFSYDLGSVENTQKLSLGLWYHSNQAGIFKLQYENRFYMVGLSYDLPMHHALSNLRGGGVFEVAMTLFLDHL